MTGFWSYEYMIQALPAGRGSNPRDPNILMCESLINLFKKNNFMKKFLGIGIIGIIAAIVVLLLLSGAMFLLYVTGAFTPAPSFSLPSFPQNDAPAPIGISNTLQQIKAGNPGVLSKLSYNYINSSPEFHVNYTGNIYARLNFSVDGIHIGTFESPIYLWIAKYGKNLHIWADIISIPILGNEEIQYVDNTNGLFICPTFNYTSLVSGNVGSLLSKQGSCLRVENSIETSPINFGTIAAFNLSGLGINVNNDYNPNFDSYQSDFYGMNCTAIEGYYLSGSGSTANAPIGMYTTCLSNTYYIPLSFGANFSGSFGKVLIVLNETSIGNSSIENKVENLPYPALGTLNSSK